MAIGNQSEDKSEMDKTREILCISKKLQVYSKVAEGLSTLAILN